MEYPIYRQCICGALTLSLVVGSVVTAAEICEHGKNASACSMPGVEYLHTHFPEPERPLARAPYVLGTNTGDRTMGLSPVRFGFDTGSVGTAASSS